VYSQTHVGFALQIGVPINEFRDNTKAVGVGGNLKAYFPIKKELPIFVGLNFAYMIYGSNTQTLNQNLNVTAGNTVISSIPVNFDITTNNNLINSQLALRFKAPLEKIQPYVEGAIGLNYLYTRTKIYDNTPNRIFSGGNNGNNNSNVISARTQINSFAFTYGVGGGFLIKLGETTFLDIRGLYMRGGEAEYYDRSQTQSWKLNFSGTNNQFNPSNPNNLEASAEGTPKRSKTDMFLIDFGLVFAF
jgi:hypothetical protein